MALLEDIDLRPWMCMTRNSSASLLFDDDTDRQLELQSKHLSSLDLLLFLHDHSIINRHEPLTIALQAARQKHSTIVSVSRAFESENSFLHIVSVCCHF